MNRFNFVTVLQTALIKFHEYFMKCLRLAKVCNAWTNWTNLLTFIVTVLWSFSAITWIHQNSPLFEKMKCVFFRQFSSSAEDAAKGLQLTYPTSAHNSFMFLYFHIHSAPDIQRCYSQFLKVRYCHPDLRFTPLDACVAQEKNVPPRMMTVYVSW